MITTVHSGLVFGWLNFKLLLEHLRFGNLELFTVYYYQLRHISYFCLYAELMETFSEPSIALLTTSFTTTQAITSGNATVNATVSEQISGSTTMPSVSENSLASNVNGTRPLPQGVLLLAMYYIIFVV